MKDFESHEESQCREVPHYRSGSDTTAFRTSPGLLEHSPSSSHYKECQDKNNPAGDLPSFSFLPNNTLRIKYLEEREKLWKQLTADYCDSGIDSDGDGDGDGDINDLQCQLPLIVSQPSGNRSPTTNDDPKAEVKVLPEEVTTTFSNNSRSSYVLPAPNCKSWCNKLDSKSEELKGGKGELGRHIDPGKRMPFEKCLSIMPPNIPSLSEAEIRAQPKCSDVICGKGKFSFNHPGNIYFRSLVSKYKLEYVIGDSFVKSTITNTIVKSIQSLFPPGRFLKKEKLSTNSSETWQDIGDEAMIAKTRQALRVGGNVIKLRHQRNALKRSLAKTNEDPASSSSLSTHRH